MNNHIHRVRHGSIRTLVLFVVLLVLVQSTKPKKQLVVFSDEYDLYHPNYHHGGAWMFHARFHPCDTFGQHCTLLEPSHEVVLSVNSTLIKHMDYIQLDFRSLHGRKAHPNDTIAVYCVDEEEFPSPPADKGMTALDFFDYVLIQNHEDPLVVSLDESESSGSVVFGPLISQRCAYQFQYLQYVEPLVYQSIGASVHVEMMDGYTEPTQVRLSLTEKPGEMRASWTSGRVYQPEVLYGSAIASSKYSLSALAETNSYNVTNLCDGLAQREVPSFFRHPGYLHSAVLTDLEPGQQYFYKVGSANGIWSEEFTFVYPPAPGTKPTERPQSFFLFGDLDQQILVNTTQPKEYVSYIDGVAGPAPLGTGSAMELMIQDMQAPDSPYIGVLHVGDLSYARGRTFLWDQFGSLIQPLASKIPYMVAIGNHEYDYWTGSGDLSGTKHGFHPVGGNYGNDSSGECGVPAAKRFTMPANGNGLFWYSFEIGLVHHTVISSEHDYAPGSPMYQWLQRDLQAVNRTQTPWLLLHLHRPMYCSQDFGPDYNVSLLIREALEPLVLEYRVDIVVGGHYHAYERTCAVYKEQCRMKHDQVAAPVHLMIGSAGAVLDDATYKPVPWSAQVKSEYGYGRMHIYNATHAHFEFLQVRGRHVTDEMWIISDHQW